MNVDMDGYVVSSGDMEGERIAHVMGRSAYKEINDSDRYLQSVTITFGPGIKCHPGSQGIYVDTGKVKVVENETSVSAFPPFGGIIPNQQDMSLIHVVVENKGNMSVDKAFVGWWRFSICLDCGKDLPEWAREMKMSNPTLINDLSTKLGIPFCEVGDYY